MWADFMKEAVALRANVGGGSFGKPSGMVSVAIDPATGCLAGPESLSTRMELFIAGTEPASPCFSPDYTLADAEETLETEEESIVEDAEPETEENREGDKGLVEVCALTGLRASRDCLKTELRIFEPAREPRISCSAEFHRPDR
jgi:hypothetical protein